MQPTTTTDIRYKDITATDIAEFARSRGYSYTRQADVSTEDSVYMNPRTNALKHDVISMMIDGYACEQYVASYLPISLYSNKTTPNAGVVSQARFYVQVFAVHLPFTVENLYVESKTNLTLNNVIGWASVYFAKGETVRLEGNFNDFFRVHTPLRRQELTAFTILAPNVMLRMLTTAGNFDFEFSGDTVYFYKTFASASDDRASMTRNDFEALHSFGVDAAKAMVRAGRPAKIIDPSLYVPMWTLYGVTKAYFMWSLIRILAFLFALAFPLLWPAIGIVIIRWVVRYVSLKAKLKRFAAEPSPNQVANQSDSSIIKS